MNFAITSLDWMTFSSMSWGWGQHHLLVWVNCSWFEAVWAAVMCHEPLAPAQFANCRVCAPHRLPAVFCVGGVWTAGTAAPHAEHQHCGAAPRSSKETQRRHEPRKPAAEASAASAPGRHDAQWRRSLRQPPAASCVASPDHSSPIGQQQALHSHRGRSRCQTLTLVLIRSWIEVILVLCQKKNV